MTTQADGIHSDEPEVALNGWLAPDGTFYSCAEYGHVFVAKEICDDRPEVRAAADAVASELFVDDNGFGPIDNCLTEGLERLGYLKLVTRRGTTGWCYGHTLKAITPQQSDALLAWCRDARQPWPTWVDRETRRIN